MTPLSQRLFYTGPVLGVVLDWAGTTVDYGCRGPAAVFVKTFKEFGVSVQTAEARRFMGLSKKDHIRAMCNLPSVKAQWLAMFNRIPTDTDIDTIYRRTEPMMVKAVSAHADMIPGILEAVDGLRARKIRIGSSTGYTRPMMDVLAPAAEKTDIRRMWWYVLRMYRPAGLTPLCATPMQSSSRSIRWRPW